MIAMIRPKNTATGITFMSEKSHTLQGWEDVTKRFFVMIGRL